MKIFLAHAKEDEAVTESIYERLKNIGYTPWMDIKDIPGGVNWDFEIQKNFNAANIIILILSNVSISKNGYIRREINDAIEKLRYYKQDDIFIIPLRIDDCEVPDFISSKLQFIDFKRIDSWDKLEKSLAIAASQQNLELTQGVSFGPFNFISEATKEVYDRVPGHEIEISYPKIESKTLPNSAKLISQYLSGRTSNLTFLNRTSPWGAKFPFDEKIKSSYTSFYNEGYNIAHCNQNIISILHGIHWYGAGAAHPNSNFETSNFVITNEDYAYKFQLYDLFKDGWSELAVNKIKERIKIDCEREYWEKTGEKPTQSDLDTFTDGINTSDLSNFTLDRDGLTFHFAPYEIHCYALGTWQFFISFYEVIDFIETEGIYSLTRN